MRWDLRDLALTAGIALLAALPYLAAGVSQNFIALDDRIYIYENPQVLRGLTWETARWALTSTEHANWYPLRRLSHLVDVSLFGLDARGHHLVSVGWHAAAAALLLLALRSMTGATWRSFAVAGLFAAHPIQVESVAWAAERSNVLAGFFFALTLLLWARYARRPGLGRYGAVLLCCALGLVAKPVLVTLPFLLLLLDFWPLGRMSTPGAPTWRIAAPLLGKRLLEKAPLLVLATVAGGIAIAAHRQFGALSTLEELPFGVRLANALLSYWRYIGKMLWPMDLAVLYPHPGESASGGWAVLAGALLAALTALVLLLARRRPWLAAGWLWCAGMLVPTIGLVQFGRQAMADRFAYLPSIGLFLTMVWIAAEGLPASLRRAAQLGPAAAAALATMMGLSSVQAGSWKDSETLFRHALAVTGDNWMIRNNLGAVLTNSGRHEEALEHYRAAIRIQPGSSETHANLGSSLAALGRHVEAIECLREATRLQPNQPNAHAHLGYSLLALGRHDEAIAQYREAIRLQPGLPQIWFNLGLALTRLGEREEAISCFREALRLRPDYEQARLALALTEEAAP